MIGFHALNLDQVVKEVTERCTKCPMINFIWKARSPLESALWKKRGPDSLIDSVLSPDPLSFVSGDELGALKIEFKDGTTRGI